MEESSKIWECIKRFHRKPAQTDVQGADQGADDEKANNIMMDINEK
jgi:hypothetical protein